jgi:prepilin-type N-terminal cleavage/methylation domain-containing protein
MISRIVQNAKRSRRKGFTLLEVVLSMGILALLAGSIYAISNSAITASRTTMEQQLTLRRVDAFLRVTRDALLNLPAQATVSLDVARGRGGGPEPRLTLGNVQGLFGVPSLGGGSLVLAARPRSDGSRTITMLRIPAKAGESEIATALAAPGTPLLPGVRKPRWLFLRDDSWKEECPAGSPRPTLIKLQFEINGLPDPVEAIFFVPPVTALPPDSSASSSPSPSPTPGS